MEPKHERRKLMYLQWDDKFEQERPYQIVSENIPELDGLARSNIQMGEGPEELIEDIRGRECTFSLDQNGFQIIKHQFPSIDYQSNDDVENVYKPEIERLLKEQVCALFGVVTSYPVCSPFPGYSFYSNLILDRPFVIKSILLRLDL